LYFITVFLVLEKNTLGPGMEDPSLVGGKYHIPRLGLAKNNLKNRCQNLEKCFFQKIVFCKVKMRILENIYKQVTWVGARRWWEEAASRDGPEIVHKVKMTR
jgi:hypothetical protein